MALTEAKSVGVNNLLDRLFPSSIVGVIADYYYPKPEVKIRMSMRINLWL